MAQPRNHRLREAPPHHPNQHHLADAQAQQRGALRQQQLHQRRLRWMMFLNCPLYNKKQRNQTINSKTMNSKTQKQQLKTTPSIQKQKRIRSHLGNKKWNAWDAFCYVCIPSPNILLCLISGSLRLFFFQKQKIASPLADGVPDNPVMRTCKGVQAWNFIIHNHALSYIIIQHHTTPDSRIHYRTSCLLFVLLHSFTTAAQVRELAAAIH